MKVCGGYVVFDDEESLGNLREIRDEAQALTNEMVEDLIEKIKNFYEGEDEDDKALLRQVLSGGSADGTEQDPD